MRRRRETMSGSVENCSGPATTPEEFLTELRRLLDTHGYLSSRMIEQDDALPTAAVVTAAFGSLLNAYEMAGWKRTRAEIFAESAVRQAKRRHARVAARPER